jgi:hypothetical protein
MQAFLVVLLLAVVAGVSFSMAYFWPGRTNSLSVADAAPASPPTGPTGEETAAFLLLGLEDGAPLTPFGYGDTVRAKQEGSSPAKYVAKVDGQDFIVSVSQDNKCNYTVIIVDTNGEDRMTADFSRMSVIEKLKDGRPSVSAKDFLCQNEHECQGFTYPEGVDGERWLKAYDYFKTSFCTGRAF